MANTLRPIDLIEPRGQISESMFPADARGDRTEAGTLEYRVQAYLDDADSEIAAYVAEHGASLSAADENIAARYWALYRAYQARYVDLSSNPATVNTSDQGSKTHIQVQVQTFASKAKEYLDAYTTFMGRQVAVEDADMPVDPGATTSVTNTFHF